MSSIGAIKRAVIFVNFMKMLSYGPATSFKGSPPVSPVTAAMCVGVPFIQKFLSMYFLALSHMPPPNVKKGDNKADVANRPRSMVPKAYFPSMSPIAMGETIAKSPSAIICLSTFLAPISTQRA